MYFPNKFNLSPMVTEIKKKKMGGGSKGSQKESMPKLITFYL